jgi:hypothetical protein
LCDFFHSPVTSSLLGPNILLRTLFSNTISLCFSLSVRYQVSHPNTDITNFLSIISEFSKHIRSVQHSSSSDFMRIFMLYWVESY